jgi:hypothetical protein
MLFSTIVGDSLCEVSELRTNKRVLDMKMSKIIPEARDESMPHFNA